MLKRAKTRVTVYNLHQHCFVLYINTLHIPPQGKKTLLLCIIIHGSLLLLLASQCKWLSKALAFRYASIVGAESYEIFDCVNNPAIKPFLHKIKPNIQVVVLCDCIHCIVAPFY